MPKILDVLIAHTISYPTSFEDDYCKENNLDPAKINEKQRVQMENSCLLKWKDILIEMRNNFDEAMADSTPYDDKNDIYNEIFFKW